MPWPMLMRGMNTERRIAIFRNGRSQAIRIPKDFELPGTEAVIRKEGARLIIEPQARRPNLLEVLATLKPLPPEDRFPEIDDPPPEPVELWR